MPMLMTLRMRLPVWPFHAPLRTSPPLQTARDALRAAVPFHAKDRYLANDVAWAKAAVLDGSFADLPALGLF